MKVTQKEFINAMTGNETILAGQTMNVLEADEVYCACADYLRKCDIVNKRTCKAYSKHLEFSGGSRLDLYGNKYGKYEYPEFDVYYCACYEKDKTEPYIVCWYLIEK